MLRIILVRGVLCFCSLSSADSLADNKSETQNDGQDGDSDGEITFLLFVSF